MNIRVTINGQIADLPPQGLNLPMTYSLKSRDGININTGSRSEYAFELPATKQNNIIFENFYDVGGITINKQIFLDASIEVDGLPFFIGKCQLQSVTIRDDFYSWQGKAYKIAFYGSNSDWVVKIGDLRIADLSFSTHTYSYLDNLTAWGNEYPTNDYKYIPLKLKDYSSFGQLDSLEDSHPALFIVDILNKTFNSIGYTMQSNFFATQFAERLIMPVPLLSNTLDEQYGEDYLNIAANSASITLTSDIFAYPIDTQTTFPLIGANPYNTTTYQYTAPRDGFYLTKLRVVVTNTALTVGYIINVNQNGGAAFGASIAFFQNGIYTAERVLQMQVGDTFVVQAIRSFGIGQLDAQVFLEVVGEAEIVDGLNLDFQYIIDKSLRCIDFIKGLAHAFNLTFETNDGSRTVIIEPSDTYLIESKVPSVRSLEDGFYNSEQDYTPYIDLSKGGELVSDTKLLNEFRLKWKDDSNDPTVERLNENEDLGILEARFVFPNERFKKGETIIENPFFAPTLVIADEEIKYTDSIKTPMIPFIWSENYFETSTSSEKPDKILPRILVSDDSKGQPNGEILVYDGTSIIVENCPLTYMLDYNDTNGYQTSLSFGNAEINGFNITGLMQRFYLSELVRRQSGKYLQIFMLWDIVKVRNLTFREKIVLNGNKYILQEINAFSVSKNASTKTYLVYDFKEPDAEDKIQNTIIAAKINII